ncbi:MAG: ABC transporter ATP-binding protein [Planctomycetota bacterium]
MNDTAVQIDGLSKAFGSNRALDDVSLGIPTGSIYGLLGPNGAGKTTLFSIAAGFLQADAGQIEILGQPVKRLSELSGRVTILPQDALFARNVPIVEQLVFLRRLDGADKQSARQDVVETLERVGLGEYLERGVQALSHGMLKRMGIAQAFMGNPDVILLDEPTSGLDPQNAKQIRDLIAEFRSTRNATTIISSHNLAEIQELCDHVAILDHGKVVAEGPVGTITGGQKRLDLTLSTPFTPHQLESLRGRPEVRELIQRDATRIRFELQIPEGQPENQVGIELLRSILDMGHYPREMSQGDSLEEFFLQITGDGED